MGSFVAFVTLCSPLPFPQGTFWSGEEAVEFPIPFLHQEENRAAFICKVVACLGAARSTGLRLASLRSQVGRSSRHCSWKLYHRRPPGEAWGETPGEIRTFKSSWKSNMRPNRDTCSEKNKEILSFHLYLIPGLKASTLISEELLQLRTSLQRLGEMTSFSFFLFFFLKTMFLEPF